MMSTKTKYFQNCLGVFQGGGCRGAAFAGAYEKAVDCGVSFSELVGTSAGSIVATLIGAGAEPKKLCELIKEMSFKDFVEPATLLSSYKPPKYSGLIKYIPNKYTQKYHRIFTHLGLHNSQFINKWMNEQLKKLLPDVRTNVKFRDLIIPTSVVVSDITTKRIKVYGTNETPDEDVADAVQKSCNIPFFFQPLEMRYVDGGILSNLPSIVFENNPNKMFNKILAFSLESDDNTDDLNDLERYSNAVLSTALEGGLDLQLSLQANVQIIKINTGNVYATDFEKIDAKVLDFLIERGKHAVNVFFAHETSNIKISPTQSNISPNLYSTYNLLIQTLENNYNEILIADINTKWMYEMFPTLLKWRGSKTNIYVFIQKSSTDKDHETFRKIFLESIGITVNVLDDLPFRGYIIDGIVQGNCQAVIFNSDSQISHYHSKHYFGIEDFEAIKVLRDRLYYSVEKIKPNIRYDLVIEHAKASDYGPLLRAIKEYNNDNIDVSVKSVPVENIKFLTKYVLGFKYRQIHTLFDLFAKFGFDPFEPSKLILNDGKFTFITPPVLEYVEGNYYLIEGNTRLLYAYRNNIKNVKCIVIEGVNALRVTTAEHKVSAMILSDKVLTPQERYEGFNHAYFRDIEKAIRDPKTCLQ